MRLRSHTQEALNQAFPRKSSDNLGFLHPKEHEASLAWSPQLFSRIQIGLPQKHPANIWRFAKNFPEQRPPMPQGCAHGHVKRQSNPESQIIGSHRADVNVQESSMTYWPDHPSSGNQKRFEDDLKGSVSAVSFMIPSCAETLPKLNERRGHQEVAKNHDWGKHSGSPSNRSSILCTNSDLEKDRLKGKCNRQRDEQPDLHVISKNKARKEIDDAEKRMANQ
jgi:hypothetical protein